MLDIATLGIGLETKSLERGQRALDDLQRQGNKTADTLDKTGARGSAAMGKVASSATAAGAASQTAFGKMVSGATGAAGAFQRLQAAALPALAAAFGVTQVIQAADAYTKFTAQLKLATESQAAYNQALQTVERISSAAQGSIGAIGTLYARIARNTEQLGFSQLKVAAITESVALALKANGASGAEAASAMLQLSQAFGAGALRGEEFNAINEAAPNLIRAIADSLGVTQGEMKKLAEEGLITSAVMGEALPAALEKFREEAAQVRTIGGAFTELQNAITKMIGEVGNSTGAIETVSDAITGLAAIAKDSGPIITGVLTGLAAGAVVAGMAALAANIGAVASAVRNLALAAIFLSGNPVAMAILGIGTIVGGFVYLDEKRKKLEENTTAIQKLSEKSMELASIESQLSKLRNDDGSIKAGVNRLVVRDLLQQELRLRQEIAEIENPVKKANAAAQEKFAAEQSFKALTAELDMQDQIAKELERIAKLEQIAGAEAANAAKQALEAQIKQAEGYKARTEQLELENKLGRSLTPIEQRRLELQIQYGKNIPAIIAVEQKRLELAEEQSAALKAQADAQKEAEKVIDGARDRVRSIEDQIRAIEEETAKIGLSTEALNALEIAKLDDVIATKQQRIEMLSYGDANDELIAQYRAEIAELQKLKGAKQGLFNAQAVEQEKQAFEQFAGKILDAFSKGTKSGLQFLRESLRRQVFEFFLSPKILGSALSSLAGAFGFGGAANAADGAASLLGGGGGGLGSLVSGVKSAFDFISGGFASIGNAAFEGALKLTEFTSLSLESSLTVANGAALAAQTLAGIAGGIGAGRAISGGFAIGGGTGNSAVNIGTAIGAIAGGPIGALIGGAIGGFANRLFGRKTVLGASGIQGDFTGAGLSNAQTFQDVTQKGGFFRSSRSFTQFGALDPKALQAINDAFGDVSKAAQDASRALSSNFTAAFESFSLSGRLGGSVQEVLNNASNAFVTKIIDETLGSLADGFKEFLNSIKQDQEQLIDAYVRVSRSVTVANRAMIALGQASQFSIRNAETAFELITQLGDQGVQLLDQFVARFVPASEQAEIAAKNFELSLKNLGLETKLSANTTREEFKKLVQGLDLTTAAGQRELQTLLQIMPELDAIISRREQEEAAIKALSASIEANVKRIRGDFQGLLAAIATRTNTTSLRITEAINSITAQPFVDFVQTISTATPSEDAYRDFIATVGKLQPTAGGYLAFIESISGLTPNTAAYKAFTDAVSGAKPTDAAYRDFVANVSGLVPTDELYQAFIESVSKSKPSELNFTRFVTRVQLGLNSINPALDLLQAQIQQLENEVVTVDFSNFTTQINQASANIAQLGTEIAGATDIGTRLQLEDQLQQAIVTRYELEQQMLGGVFASIQELFGQIKNERVAVRDAATQILGGPRVLSPNEIRGRVADAGNLGTLPTAGAVDSANQLLAQRQAQLDSATQLKNQLGSNLALSQDALFLQRSIARQAVDRARQVGSITNVQTQDVNGNLNNFGYDENSNRIVGGINNLYGFVGQSDFQGWRDFFDNVRQGFAFAEQGLTLRQAFDGANGRIAQAESALLAAENAVAANLVTVEQAQKALVDAERIRAQAQQDFAEQIQQFVIDAGKATSQLGKLREETVRYFQEQQRLAQALTASSQGLRQTVADIRFNDLNPAQQLAKLQADFAVAFARAQSATGDNLAAAGNDLNALINPILQKAGEVFASGSQFQSIKEAILSQAEQVAGRIESLTPVNYQQESLALLDTIDTTLALIETNTKSAEALIVEAIGNSADRTVGALAEIYRGITGKDIPAFANGGNFKGGLRLVGERGPELEVTGPSRIIPNNQLMGMVGGGNNAAVVAELRALRQEVAASGNINLKVVTPDGKVVMQQTIKEIKERSRKGELIVYADGVQ